MNGRSMFDLRSAPIFWKGLGIGFLALGTLGILLPVLPTTVFWLLALVCLTKAGDPRAEWILAHPRFGEPIRRFLADGSMTRNAKLAAYAGMGVGAVVLLSVAAWAPPVAVVGWLLLTASAVYIGTRPEPVPAVVIANGRRRARSKP